MFSTIVRDIFAVVGVVATIAGVWIGVIAYLAAKGGERRILREIKRKTRPRYVIGQVAGWMALRPWSGGSPPPQQIDKQPAHPTARPPRRPSRPWRRPRPEVPSEVPWRPSPPEVDLPSYQTRPGPAEPLSRDPGQLDRPSRDLRQASISSRGTQGGAFTWSRGSRENALRRH